MKRYIPAIAAAIVIALFGASIWFLYSKSKGKPKKFETTTVSRGDIIKKSVATGQLVPREEIEIKPRVSGIIGDLKVEEGDLVKEDDLLATIQIVPNVIQLNQAESRVDSARIAATNAKSELERHQALFNQGVISQAEVARYKVDYDLKRQEQTAARNNLTLVRKGALGKAKKSNNQVRSTIKGMVLEVPIKEGVSVIESNTFNAGTTIAVVADMSKIIFEGKIDESEVGRLGSSVKELKIRVGALDGVTLKGDLSHISPKGIEEQGTMQFVIKADVTIPEDVLIRAGYSATADIVLDRRKDVLTVEERAIIFEDKKRFVEIKDGDKYRKQEIKTGLSDGIKVEVLDGLKGGEVLKVQARTS